MATQLRTVTADELLAMPDDGIRREIVDGEVREMVPAGWEHSVVAANLASDLNVFVRKNKLGAVGTDTVRVPDVAFVRRERLQEAGGAIKGFVSGPPDLAVEVVSPNDLYSEVRAKVREYLAAGTAMVIVLDAGDRSATVYRPGRAALELTEADVIDGEDVVPGWKLPVRDIFN